MIFFGTSDFAAELLKHTVEQGFSWDLIVTRPDRLQGRKLQLTPPPVKQMHSALNLTTGLMQPEKVSTEEFAQILRSYQPDLFVVVAFGEILRQHILDIPAQGAINIHTSLLPHYRGAAPMQRCLMEGARITGVTIQEMSLQMDAGDILDSKSFNVPLDWNLAQLKEKMLEMTKPLLLDVIKNIEYKRANKTKQDDHQVSFAPKIRTEETKIDWLASKENIHNKIRSLSPEPGAWAYYEVAGSQKRIKLIKTFPYTAEKLYEVGKVIFIPDVKKVVIQTSNGLLELSEVIPEGKKKMTAIEFLRGCKSGVKLN